MRTGLVLVAALMGCGGDEMTVRRLDAGNERQDSAVPVDAWRDAGRDAGRDSGMDAQASEHGGSGGSDGPQGGSGGQPDSGAPSGGSGGAGSGGQGGSGAGGSGGSEAPQERVLWSKSIIVEVHSPLGYGAQEGEQMGLRIETDKYHCTVGDEPQASGTTKDYEMDGSCLAEFAETGTLSWAVLFYRANGEPAGLVKREDLDWTLDGETVTKLRRTVTWSLDRLCDIDLKCWNYADFTGTWEVIGY